MPYYPQLNLLHLHCPKTGGTSLENTLQAALGERLFDQAESKRRASNGDTRWQRENMYGHAEIDKESFALQHMTYTQMLEWGHLSTDDDDRPEKPIDMIVAVVRNPYSRIVSEYYWQRLFGLQTSFSEFVHYVHDKEVYKSRQHYQHLVPQATFVDQLVGDERLHVVYFEHINEAMPLVFEEIVARCPDAVDKKKLCLRKDNVQRQKNARRPSWQEHYQTDTALAQLVYKMYRCDFELFGYARNISADD